MFKKIIKFLIVGVLNTFVNLCGMLALLFLDVYYLFASAFGFFLGAISGFTLNFYWTFYESSMFMKKFYKYFIIQVMNLFLTLFMVFSITEFFLIIPVYSQIIAIIVTTGLNFYLSSKFVFIES